MWINDSRRARTYDVFHGDAKFRRGRGDGSDIMKKDIGLFHRRYIDTGICKGRRIGTDKESTSFKKIDKGPNKKRCSPSRLIVNLMTFI